MWGSGRRGGAANPGERATSTYDAFRCVCPAGRASHARRHLRGARSPSFVQKRQLAQTILSYSAHRHWPRGSRVPLRPTLSLLHDEPHLSPRRIRTRHALPPLGYVLQVAVSDVLSTGTRRRPGAAAPPLEASAPRFAPWHEALLARLRAWAARLRRGSTVLAAWRARHLPRSLQGRATRGNAPLDDARCRTLVCYCCARNSCTQANRARRAAHGRTDAPRRGDVTGAARVQKTRSAGRAAPFLRVAS